MLVGGAFTTVDGVARNRIARLNADGSLDPSFDPGPGADDTVWALAIQVDGQVLAGGEFTTMDGVARSRIARLNRDGTLDVGLNPGAGPNLQVQAVSVQPDGKVLIGGYFTSFDGTDRNRIARINMNGSLDTSFDPGTGAGGPVRSVRLQPDGKVLIGGNFTTYNSVERIRIARLNSTGVLDNSFDPGIGPNDQVLAMAVHDSKVFIGGYFTTVDGTAATASPASTPTGPWTPALIPASGRTTGCYPWRSRPTVKC